MEGLWLTRLGDEDENVRSAVVGALSGVVGEEEAGNLGAIERRTRERIKLDQGIEENRVNRCFRTKVRSHKNFPAPSLREAQCEVLKKNLSHFETVALDTHVAKKEDGHAKGAGDLKSYFYSLWGERSSLGQNEENRERSKNAQNLFLF